MVLSSWILILPWLTKSSAYFDEHGNIMVTNEGTLPSQRIAKRFVLQVGEVRRAYSRTALTLPEIRRPLWYTSSCLVLDLESEQ
jgi:hypothetical protein